jgi:urease accessory protein
MSDSLTVLLHLCDSLFPIGSFAHSDGLEAATTERRVATSQDLRGWMDVVLSETLRRIEGPALHRTWQAFVEHRFDEIAALDDEVHALRPTSSGREATRAMGGRLLKTWQQIRPGDRIGRLALVRASFTLPVAFGAVSAASSIPVGAALEGFMYTRLAAIISAAMRLMAIGQREGHALLADVLAGVPAVAGAVLTDAGPLGSFTPALDLMAIRQQYGHSRLFRS